MYNKAKCNFAPEILVIDSDFDAYQNWIVRCQLNQRVVLILNLPEHFRQSHKEKQSLFLSFSLQEIVTQRCVSQRARDIFVPFRFMLRNKVLIYTNTYSEHQNEKTLEKKSESKSIGRTSVK